MIESDDEASLNGTLKQLAREIFLISVASIIMALPCYLCGLIIFSLGD
jgi:hypothetical protein